MQGGEDRLWKKNSIFWTLPYWRDLQVRHCLDVMHIEKNVCDAILETLINIPGKTKNVNLYFMFGVWIVILFYVIEDICN